MKRLRKILSAQDVDMSKYENMGFNELQMIEIQRGLEEGLDVSIYADPKFDNHQMYEIQRGLERGLDVSIYADPKFDRLQMQELRLGLNDGVDVSKYADPRFNVYQMEEIRLGLKDGVDVSVYADPKFSQRQMMKMRMDQDPSSSRSSSNSTRATANTSYLKNLFLKWGVDLTPHKYKLIVDKGSRYDFGDTNVSYRFKAYGDYFALFSAIFCRPIRSYSDLFSSIEEFSGEVSEETLSSDFGRTIEDIQNTLSRIDNGAVYLVNLDTGEDLFGEDPEYN